MTKTVRSLYNLCEIKVCLIIVFIGTSTLLKANALGVDSAKEYLLILDKRVDEAWYSTRDKEFLSDLLAENFVYVHSGAALIESKSDVMENLKFIPNISRSGMDIRLYGDTAVVSGFSTISNYKSFDALKFHIQRTYVKNTNRWQLLAQHVTFNLGETELMRDEVRKYIHQRYWSN